MPTKLQQYFPMIRNKHDILKEREVKIVEVLPGDSSRIADEQSLLIMDIVVRFEDGTYCNVEVQKIGYAFPGERSACYSSDLLQNYIFIPFDIFRENVQTKGIKNKLDAWLAFLSMDEPEQIIDLITVYPEFKVIYEHVYNICRNVEELMGIFSEELKILDRNTVKYMVDQMQETINEQKAQIAQQKIN